jgi:putative ABC transport system substrate-binding protein
MEWRYAEGHPDRLPELAAELVRAQVDVIVTHGTPATLALKQATKTIPIVFATIGHPVEKGIVASRARPGGNITGLAFQVGLSKYYQLLKEVAPTTDRVVVLYDPHSDPPVVDEWVRQARAMNMEWQAVALRGDVAQAFAAFGRGTNGLVLSGAGPLQRSADQICKLALQRRLPTAAFFATRFPEAGCLMSYGENLDDMWRRAAAFVDKILKGANPADLPVEQPTKFELVINLKAAKALGLTIPPSLLLRADQVIE